MRIKVLAFAASLLLISNSSAGIPQTPTTNASQRDPQAVLILQKSLSSVGGATAFSGIQDFEATGSLIESNTSGTTQSSIVVRGKGLGEFRLDVTTLQGPWTMIVNGSAGSFTKTDGTIVSIPYSNLFIAGAMTLPALRLIEILANTSTSVQYLGLVPRADGQAHKVHVIPTLDSSLIPPQGASQFGSFDLFIDPSSFQVVEISEMYWPTGNSQALLHEISFANYEKSGIVSVPFIISELVNGQATWKISVSAISFNNGLSESLFVP